MPNVTKLKRTNQKQVDKAMGSIFDTVVPLQSGGRSQPYDHPGHGSGRFDFDAEPQHDAELGIDRYLFVNEAGDSWYLPLETNMQGGRWENAEHAEADWNRYLAMGPGGRKSTFRAMWGEGPVAERLLGLAAQGADIQDVRRALKPLDTWRSISAGEPTE